MDKIGKMVRVKMSPDDVWQVANATDTPAGVVLELVIEEFGTTRKATVFEGMVEVA